MSVVDGSIIAQTATKAAAEVVAAQVAAGQLNAEDVGGEIISLTEALVDNILDLAKVEKVAQVFGASAKPERSTSSAPAKTPRPSQPSRPSGGGRKSKGHAAPSGISVLKFSDDLGEASLDILPAECPSCGGTDVWDNRPDHAHFGGEGSEKRPYFKCADKNCGQGFWPPRDDDF
jgi:hypothetical protein